MALFGDRVCARFDGQKCVPTPAARLWIKEMNQMMKGGHCEGMAAMSAAFHVKTEKPSDYGAPVPFSLQPKDGELMRTISTYFVTQALEPVQSVTIPEPRTSSTSTSNATAGSTPVRRSTPASRRAPGRAAPGPWT